VRLRAGLLMVLVLLSLIAGRLVWLQGFQATAYAGQAVEQRLQTTTLLAPRGTISDRNGQVLALSVDARAVFAEPRTIARATCKPDATRPCDPRSIARVLAPALDLPLEEVREKLSRPKVTTGVCTPADPAACSGFVYLARGLEPEAANAVRDLGLIGVGVMSEPKRVHPGADLGANVLGFTSLDDTGGTKGAGGVELALDEVLAGRDGRSQAEVDGDGRVIPNGSAPSRSRCPARRPADPRPRPAVVRAGRPDAQGAGGDAESGTAVVMDVKTGEVLALASVPTFDADAPGAAPEELRGNRAITDIFEPGSIGKVMTVAAGLEAGAVTPDTVSPCPTATGCRTRSSRTPTTTRPSG
jgi:cell division protein FtsI (penicillin-binding protein 3)